MRSFPARLIVWILAVAVAFVGGWVSYALTAKHLRVPIQGDQLAAQACVATQTANCDKVMESKWGRFPFGREDKTGTVPTAELGMAYFVFVLAWLLLIGWATASRWWAHLVFVMIVAAGMGFAAFLAYVMYTQLENWCPLCAITHAAALVLFVLSLLLWPRRGPALERVPVVVGVPQSPPTSSIGLFASPVDSPSQAVGERAWPHAWMLVVTPFVALLGVVALDRQLSARSTAIQVKQYKAYTMYQDKKYNFYDSKWQHTLVAYQLTPKLEIPVEGRPTRGPADARHTVIIYSDFQCPHCKKFSDWFEKSIVPTGTNPAVGGLRVIFKHWPISKTCNEFASNDLHPVACQGAYAAEAAYVAGGDAAFWRMHNLLFERQEEWTKAGTDLPAYFAKLAREINLDAKAFADAISGSHVRERVRKDIEEGYNHGIPQVREKTMTEDDREWIRVNSTPAVFIDGKRLFSPQHVATWNAITGYAGRVRTGGSTATRPAGPFIRSPAGTVGPVISGPATAPAR